jgi:hypothetical protein
MKISAVALLSTLVLVGLAGRPAAAADTASVSGYAYDCAAEHPLGGATVVFHNGADSRTIKTTSDGKFTVLGLSAGTYAVELSGDVWVDPRVVRSTFSLPTRSQTATVLRLTTTRTLSVVPNDLVSMRIGVGAGNGVLGHVVPLKCDPDVVAVTPGPIERTTVISH